MQRVAPQIGGEPMRAAPNNRIYPRKHCDYVIRNVVGSAHYSADPRPTHPKGQQTRSDNAVLAYVYLCLCIVASGGF